MAVAYASYRRIREHKGVYSFPRFLIPRLSRRILHVASCCRYGQRNLSTFSIERQNFFYFDVATLI